MLPGVVQHWMRPGSQPAATPRAGQFAEQIREQWLQERMEYFSELEQAIFDEALGEDECTRPQVQAALQKLNPDLPEAKARALPDVHSRTDALRCPRRWQPCRAGGSELQTAYSRRHSQPCAQPCSAY